MTTLFGKLQEHDQELMNLEKHEKNQKKEKKEKDKNTERKSIALKASRYKSSTKDACESESSDDDKDSNEDMGLFIRSIVDGACVPLEDIIKDQEENHVEPHPEKDEEKPDLISEKKEEDNSIDNNDIPLE
ncbi:uncharacterized protein LOC127130325 [Lathyrus oleraceus]|uniref:uncharacterized protein LOC127130325 n=1 Tax=Pisum sativum TaxID=3888 RepID=UPI0021D02DDF|nr:uncharacterized protein LOC127130325 [Pisum sativum]